MTTTKNTTQDREHIVTGKRGPGRMRVEWVFTPTTAGCSEVCRIYGSCGTLLVERPMPDVALTSAQAAVACIDACPGDKRTVRAS